MTGGEDSQEMLTSVCVYQYRRVASKRELCFVCGVTHCTCDIANHGYTEAAFTAAVQCVIGDALGPALAQGPGAGVVVDSDVDEVGAGDVVVVAGDV
eukprot:1137718-Rhodomonas_salina.1